MNRKADSSKANATSNSARIDVQREQDLQQWARKLDASEAQIKEAVQAVGDNASDVEEHLKGSRSTTNSERTHDVLKGGSGKGGERPA